MPSSVPAVKAGLRQYLRTTEGLRPTNGLSVRCADPEPEDMTTQLVVLGSATTSQTQAGLAARAEAVTLTCSVLIVKIGVGETKADEARARAYEVYELVEGAIKTDRAAAGTVPPPGRLDIASTALEEFPVLWGEHPGRKAQLQFQVSWTSHIT
jgi:hypothetical protein